jgi:2-oxoisovalerate dehydrogenase E1 component
MDAPRHAAEPAAPAPRMPDGAPITMPFGDLTIDSGRLVRWTVDEGTRVRQGDSVAEIETDKAVVEIEAPADGFVARLIVEPGAVIKMGGAIGVVRT